MEKAGEQLAWQPLALCALRSYLQPRKPATDRCSLLNVTWAFRQTVATAQRKYWLP